MIKNLINFFIYIFFLTFLIIDTKLPYNIFGLRIFVVDFIFLLLIVLIFLNKKINFIKFCFNYKNFSFIEAFAILIVLLFLIKFSLNTGNFYNFYQLFTLIYILIIYTVFKYLLLNLENFEEVIINNFIYIFLISVIITFVSVLLYHFNIEISIFSLWEYANHYPYHDKPVVHFHGLIKNYNMLAYTMVPGFIFLIFDKYINKPLKFVFILTIFTLILALIIKVKIFILVFSISLVFLVFYKFRIFSYSKFFLIFSITIILVIYFLVTNFILLDSSELAKLMVFKNPKYYTLEPLTYVYNYNIHGTFFYKLKLVAFEQAKSFNFIFFNSLDFLSFFDTYANNKDNDYSSILNSEPHSHYFSFLGDFGLIGFLIILIFSFLPFYFLFKEDFNPRSMASIVILIIFFIEGINTDIINFRFIWIILALIYFNFYLKKLK